MKCINLLMQGSGLVSRENTVISIWLETDQAFFSRSVRTEHLGHYLPPCAQRPHLGQTEFVFASSEAIPFCFDGSQKRV
jgi:hypothetical protein